MLGQVIKMSVQVIASSNTEFNIVLSDEFRIYIQKAVYGKDLTRNGMKQML